MWSLHAIFARRGSNTMHYTQQKYLRSKDRCKYRDWSGKTNGLTLLERNDPTCVWSAQHLRCLLTVGFFFLCEKISWPSWVPWNWLQLSTWNGGGVLSSAFPPVWTIFHWFFKTGSSTTFTFVWRNGIFPAFLVHLKWDRNFLVRSSPWFQAVNVKWNSDSSKGCTCKPISDSSKGCKSQNVLLCFCQRIC